jgi:DNA-binding NarL/FixJ family response regulator
MKSVLLLVEGCNYFRESLAHVVVQEPDLEVRQAGSLAEGYACMAAGEVDAAIVCLPNGEANEMIRKLHDASPPVPVLTLSVDPTGHAHALEAGAQEVLTKGASLEEVLAAVRRLWHKPLMRSSIY